jgi:hypothetical protein
MTSALVALLLILSQQPLPQRVQLCPGDSSRNPRYYLLNRIQRCHSFSGVRCPTRPGSEQRDLDIRNRFLSPCPQDSAYDNGSV